MPTPIDYAQLTAVLEGFRAFWSGQGGGSGFSPDARYASNHRGSAGGADVPALVRSDFAALDAVDIRLTNPLLRAEGDRWAASAYVLGQAQQSGAAVLFGGMLVLEGDAPPEGLRIQLARVHMNWTSGNRFLLPHWTLPNEQGWKPGDAEAGIVSELDAPRHRIPESSLALTDQQAIAEAWTTYAWGLDMADTGLYAHCFSEDASALLPPMGELQGRRSLTATLKAFRMPWPWIQHYGVPLEVALEPDGQAADLVIGRLIPGETLTPDGQALYGAHYRIRMVRTAGAWRIRRMEYRPGWITVGARP